MNSPERASPDYPQPEKNVADHGTETVLPAIKARQGIIIGAGAMVYVLVIGTALAIVGLVAVYLGFFASV